MSLRSIVRYTVLGRILMIPFRLIMIGLPHLFRETGLVARWLFGSKEYYNFSYHLTDLNRSYLAAYISVISGHDVGSIERYMAELEKDEQLRSVLIERTLSSPDRHSSDVEPRYGRRLGWYALVRATKPRIIVETGVDRGLGTVVLAAAVMQNAREGSPGMVYATDIVADCGHLLAEPYRKFCEILIGDSVESLRKFTKPADIFIHDSDHRPEYEWAEFLAIEPRLHEKSLVLSDNSLQTSKLLEFAHRRGLSFLFFRDQPKDHWWPGDGIGSGFTPGVKTVYGPAKPAADVPAGKVSS